MMMKQTSTFSLAYYKNQDVQRQSIILNTYYCHYVKQIQLLLLKLYYYIHIGTLL